MPLTREFTLPDLGEGLTEAEVVQWLVEIGEEVRIDQPMVVVETAKALVEIPSPYAGRVAALLVSPGQVAAVGTRLIEIHTAEHDAAAEPDAARAERRTASAEPSDAPARTDDATGGFVFGNGKPAAAVKRRGRAAIGPSRAGQTARGPELTGPERVASPLVRQLARRGGVDLGSLSGSGREGLISRADVTRAMAKAPDAEAAVTRIPLRGLRARAAELYTLSRREIPDATCWMDVDASGLLEARELCSAPGGPRLGLLALIARVCVAALVEFPDLNASVDPAGREILRSAAVHLGVAVQGARGLLVPVVRDAHARTTAELAAELDRLTAGARADTLGPAELTGSTFTLNNYGVFGVDGATPILNHPEVGMLGFGRILDRPWVRAGMLEVRKVALLSFTFDHRVCDGAYAAGFLRRVAEGVENPVSLLRSM
jgi:pyruvate dehydrogenase E2 component (dihydrolipoamide acetyltransferase)